MKTSRWTIYLIIALILSLIASYWGYKESYNHDPNYVMKAEE